MPYRDIGDYWIALTCNNNELSFIPNEFSYVDFVKFNITYVINITDNVKKNFWELYQRSNVNWCKKEI